ncbi:hypothetical protein [Mycolicibacterium vaccae]|uniref:hypothetical protein n=1 Tax=Mycolicibacterium vaccae TaxID=1810 RepID=UPI003D0670E0
MKDLHDRIETALQSVHPFGKAAGGTFPEWFGDWIATVTAQVASAVYPRVETDAELELVPRGSVVRSDAGTIACRFDGRNGVVFGDDRPFPWHKLSLPVTVLWTLSGDNR